MKKFIAIMLVAIVAFAAFANGSSEAEVGAGIAGTKENPTILRAGTSVNYSTDPNSAYMVFEREFNAKLMELSGGTIGYEVIYGSALGNNTQILAQLKAGTLDFMPTGFDLATNLKNSDKFYAVCMPYVFANDEQMDAFFETELWAEMVEDIRSANNIRILGLMCHQPARSFNTKKPIVHPSDLKGLKMRVPESTVQMELWKAMGASPTVVPGSEIYTGIESGIADGQENDIVSSVAMKFIEVAPYYTEVDYIKQCCLLYMSDTTWQKMTEQEREWLQEAREYAEEIATACYGRKMESARQAFEDGKGGLVEFDYNEWKEFFSDIVRNVFDGKFFPAGLYDQIQSTPY